DKTGLGTWILAGHNDMQIATTWTASQVTLYLEALNGAGAHIDLSHDSTASFTVASGASLLVNPADTAHLISARDIEFATGSLVGIGDGGYFSYQDLPNSGQTALLSLRASDSLTNNSTIVNPDGSFVSGFFEYSYYGLEWDVIDGLSEDLVAWIATRSYVPEVGASGATTAPIAIAAQDVVGRTLGNRRRAAFGLLSGCPEVCADLPPECAPEASGLRVWAAGLYEYTDTTGGSYLVRTPGLAVGMELANHQTMFAGLAIIGARPEYRGQHTRVDADTLDAALYGGVLLPGRIEAGAHLAIGRAWYDQKRSVYGEHYAGEYHANTWSAGADLARRFMLDDTWNIRPFAAYRYMGLHGQGYSEHNPGAYALKFDSRTEHLHFVRSGLDLGWLCRERGEIAASAYYAGFYGNTEASVGARFIQDPTGSRHVSQGDKVDRHLFGLGLSGSYRLRDNLDVYGAYNFEMGKETRSHYGNVGLSVGF
ncbi:MAG: autotransporter outer membrane beta-barrel domain-containing protein, partial [Planctomycetes bacterium]|nr:autotransporter outer membrane beta-barrel domain-containing protein [Planctomycetota bacterium]